MRFEIYSAVPTTTGFSWQLGLASDSSDEILEYIKGHAYCKMYFVDHKLNFNFDILRASELAGLAETFVSKNTTSPLPYLGPTSSVADVATLESWYRIPSPK